MLRSLPILMFLAACTGGKSSDGSETSDTDTTDTDTTTGNGLVGVAALGMGAGTLDAVIMEIVAEEADGLNKPSDIEFQPTTGKAFITNRRDHSMVILHNPDDSDPGAVRLGGEETSGSRHFLARPSALAFNSDGNWASIHMEERKTQGPTGTPADFMGPTLWTGDTAVLDAGHASHYDMLHNSPNGAGIAWVSGNAFYVFDGWHDSITFYDFNDDHGLGGADHTDGEILRCMEGEVSYVDNTVSHMVYDDTERLLYLVDTGNNRILAMDTTTGTTGAPINPNYDGLGAGKSNLMDDVDFWVAVDTEAAGMEEPAGMEIHDGVMYVTDHTQGLVYAFDMQGELLDFLDLEVGAGALQGLAIDDAGQLWFTNEDNNSIFRISQP